MLVAIAFGLAYALHLTRPAAASAPSAPVTSSAVSAPAVPAPAGFAVGPRAGSAPASVPAGAGGPAVVVAGFALAVGVVAEVLLRFVLTPWYERLWLDLNQRSQWSEEVDQYGSWLDDLRFGAVALAALGFALLVARRRSAAGLALLVFADLLLADRLAEPAMSGSPSIALTGVFGIGLVVTAGVALGWWRGRPNSRRENYPTENIGIGSGRQRAMAGLAIVAGYLALSLFGRGGWSPPAFKPMPPGLDWLTVVVAATLAALAVATALAARDSPPRLSTVLGSALAAAAVLAVAATLADRIPVQPTTTSGDSRPIGANTLLLLAPLMAVGVAALTRYRRSRGSRLRWLALAGAAVAAGAPLAFVAPIARLFLMSPWLNRSGEGWPIAPGATLLGVAAAVLLTRRSRPPARQGPRPVAEPPRIPEPAGGGASLAG